MPTHVNGEITTTVQAESYDYVTIAKTGSITASQADGIYGATESAYIEVNGSIYADFNGINLFGQYNRIVVGETGTVSGQADGGYYFQGDNNNLLNSGQITSSSKGVFAYGSNNVINNTGTISGYTHAVIFGTLGDGGGLPVTNSYLNNKGDIFGIMYGVFLLEGGQVVNSGTIHAADTAVSLGFSKF